MPRPKRRTVYLAATACAGVLAIVLAVTAFSGGTTGVTYIDGNPSALIYTAGHRPVAPDFSSTTLTGTPVSFASYRGKVLLLNFWGSWCSPCRAEASTLAVVAGQYEPAGVRFLGVDVRDSQASAEAFVATHAITYPSLNDSDDAVTLSFAAVVPLDSTPTTLVIDKTGHIAGAVFGEATYPELNSILSKVTGAGSVS